MPSDLTQEPLIWKDGGLGGGCHRGEHRERSGVDCGSYAAALLLPCSVLLRQGLAVKSSGCPVLTVLQSYCPASVLGLRATPPRWATEKCSREGLHEELLQQVFPSEQGSGGAEPVTKTVSRNTAPPASGGSKEA